MVLDQSILKCPSALRVTIVLASVAAAPMVLTACGYTSEVISHGYQLDEEALALVPEGSSREQVLLSLGTPSTTNSLPGGNETYYYISQKKARSFAFQRPSVIDQRVLAIYMDNNNTVERVANYGLKDGKVFDYIGRVTPTGGAEQTFLSQLLRSGGKINPFGT
ncbi:MAG: outer membrane protein assembly factor BamE [Rhizobiaceae bacterium]